MGKKKNKFKKKHSTNKVVRHQPETGMVTNGEEISENSSDLQETAADHEEEPNVDQELNEKYSYVRRDVRKLLITLLVLALIFVGVYFLSIKTSILATFGDWIYKVGNFQI